ncbi:unnamed protein product [Meloidogyne enterolobii]|uniref:Uncharacterized protein n=1 Tax=Meloidogyne enterolobii TaxID=390850 RepID=A0ACB0ZNB9_MELEN
MIVAMELGGMNFENYFDIKMSEIVNREAKNGILLDNEREFLLLNILKCAAKALQKFHQRKN